LGRRDPAEHAYFPAGNHDNNLSMRSSAPSNSSFNQTTRVDPYHDNLVSPLNGRDVSPRTSTPIIGSTLFESPNLYCDFAASPLGNYQSFTTHSLSDRSNLLFRSFGREVVDPGEICAASFDAEAFIIPFL
jgi:hypothetical protein